MNSINTQSYSKKLYALNSAFHDIQWYLYLKNNKSTLFYFENTYITKEFNILRHTIFFRKK